MSTDEEYCTDGCESCRTVVLRTYREFRQSGEDDRSAFRVALEVLSLRHPEWLAEERVTVLSEWLTDAMER